MAVAILHGQSGIGCEKALVKAELVFLVVVFALSFHTRPLCCMYSYVEKARIKYKINNTYENALYLCGVKKVVEEKKEKEMRNFLVSTNPKRELFRILGTL